MAAATSDPPPALRAAPERAPPKHVARPLRRVYFDVPTLASVLGWTPKRTLRWLKREKAFVRHGRHYFTTRGLLRRAFPETWHEVLSGAREAHTTEADD